MATHSSILASKISGTEEPGSLLLMGSQGVGPSWITEHAHIALNLSCYMGRGREPCWLLMLNRWILILLVQQFSTGSNFFLPPWGTFNDVWRDFCLLQLGGVAVSVPVSSGWRPETLLSSLQYTEQPSITENESSQNVKSGDWKIVVV